MQFLQIVSLRLFPFLVNLFCSVLPTSLHFSSIQSLPQKTRILASKNRFPPFMQKSDGTHEQTSAKCDIIMQNQQTTLPAFLVIIQYKIWIIVKKYLFLSKIAARRRRAVRFLPRHERRFCSRQTDYGSQKTYITKTLQKKPALCEF